ELIGAGLVDHADVRRARPRPREREQILGRDHGRRELEAVGVEDLSRYPRGVVPAADDDRVAVLKLHLLEPPVDQEIVEIERRPLLAAAEKPDIDIAAAVRIDAAGAQQEVEHRVGGDAGILARADNNAYKGG